MISIGKLVPSDRDAWEALFRAYIDFYHRAEPPEMYDRAWREFQADTRLHALGARRDGRLAGITHFFVHPSTSGPDVCYLQDLFTAPDARGQGVARALIAAVAGWARERGCGRVYWHTQASNTTARHLYDKVAENRGFIQYLIELAPAGPSVPLPGNASEGAPDDLWSALTDPPRLARWVGEVGGDLRLGGEYRYRFFAGGAEGTGRVEVCEPPRRLLLAHGLGEPYEQVIEAKVSATGGAEN